MTTDLFDPNQPAHAKALEKLRHDIVLWFTTIDERGRPHAVPVWFWWLGDRLVIFSEPTTVKVKHVRAGSPVLAHLQGDRFGEDVVILHGSAEISDRGADEWLAEFRDGYEQKYREAIADYGMPIDDLPKTFSTAIVFTPERLQAW